MSAQTALKTILLSLSSLLEEERDCLRDVRFGDLQNINRRKSEALRNLDRSVNQAKGRGIDGEELEKHVEKVRRQARRNTQLLGSALNGAKSAADVLDSIRTGEPVNRTYTALGARRPMIATKRKNNLFV